MSRITLTDEDRHLINLLASTEVDHRLYRRDPEEYRRQVAGVVDTVINRVASDQFPDTVAGVANQKRQFSKITGPKKLDPYGDVSKVPDSVGPKFFDQAVEAHLDARSSGVPSSVGGGLHYANPKFSDASNLKWINKLEGPTFGSGQMIHKHGTTAGFDPVEASLAPTDTAIAAINELAPIPAMQSDAIAYARQPSGAQAPVVPEQAAPKPPLAKTPAIVPRIDGPQRGTTINPTVSGATIVENGPLGDLAYTIPDGVDYSGPPAQQMPPEQPQEANAALVDQIASIANEFVSRQPEASAAPQSPVVPYPSDIHQQNLARSRNQPPRPVDRISDDVRDSKRLNADFDNSFDRDEQSEAQAPIPHSAESKLLARTHAIPENEMRWPAEQAAHEKRMEMASPRERAKELLKSGLADTSSDKARNDTAAFDDFYEDTKVAESTPTPKPRIQRDETASIQEQAPDPRPYAERPIQQFTKDEDGNYVSAGTISAGSLGGNSSAPIPAMMSDALAAIRVPSIETDRKYSAGEAIDTEFPTVPHANGTINNNKNSEKLPEGEPGMAFAYAEPQAGHELPRTRPEHSPTQPTSITVPQSGAVAQSSRGGRRIAVPVRPADRPTILGIDGRLVDSRMRETFTANPRVPSRQEVIEHARATGDLSNLQRGESRYDASSNSWIAK